jgi:hypothetical protein
MAWVWYPARERTAAALCHHVRGVSSMLHQLNRIVHVCLKAVYVCIGDLRVAAALHELVEVLRRQTDVEAFRTVGGPAQSLGGLNSNRYCFIKGLSLLRRVRRDEQRRGKLLTGQGLTQQEAFSPAFLLP